MAALTPTELRAVGEGRMVEERLSLGGPRPVRFGAGETLAFGPSDIHRVAHVSGWPAVTIHAYSPALRRVGAYVQSPDEVLLRHAMDEDQELRPITTDRLGAPA